MKRIPRTGIVFLIATLGCDERGREAGIPVWELVEELRVGSIDGPLSFSRIQGVAADNRGTLFVLDGASREIRMFDANGQFVRTIARAGEGPGELRRPVAIDVEGDLLRVFDTGAKQILHFDRDGRALRQTPYPFASVFDWIGTVADDGRVIESIRVRTGRAQQGSGEDSHEQRLRVVSADRAHDDTVAAPRCNPRVTPRQTSIKTVMKDGSYWSMAIPNQPRPIVAFDRRGMAWCSPTDEYLVIKSAVGRPDTLAFIKKDVRPEPANADSAEAMRRHGRLAAASLGESFDETSVPSVKPVIRAIRVDDRYRLWVRPVSVPASAPWFDLYDEAGRALARICSPIPITQIPIAVGDSVYAVTTGADDMPQVVRLRLAKTRSLSSPDPCRSR